jgi:hypothetical protein
MPHDETPALHFTQNDGRNDIRIYQPLAVHLSWALSQKSFGLRSPLIETKQVAPTRHGRPLG